nr:hypothetical protein [Tanacetum cinerariifolium]
SQESAEHPEVRKEEGKKAIDKAVAQLKGRLTGYREREVKYIEKIRILEMYRASNLKSIKILNKELEEVKLEKDRLDGKLAGLLKASKNLDHLIKSQRPSPTVVSTSAEDQNKDSSTSEDVASPNLPKTFVKETTRSQKYAYESPSHRYGGHRPHGGSMRPFYKPAGHRPHGPSMNPRRPNMNGARPYKSFFNQAPSYETRPFLKLLAVRTQYRAPWVPTVNKNNPPVSRKFSTGRRNFPTVTRKFPTASRKFTTGSTKNHTADMGRRGKAVKPSSCWTWNPSQK